MISKRALLIYLLVLICNIGYSQDEEVIVADSLYLEDQYYIGLTYNILQNRPDNVSQSNLSNGIQLGFIKDLPINSRRNKAFGIGLGYAVNTYFDNLKASELPDGTISYEVLSGDIPFTKNKFITHVIELPIQYRWRTSTATTYKFWRIYGGAKLGYLFANRFRYKDDDENLGFSNPDLNDFQYGLTLSIGYNTWNFYAYYGLNKIFDGATTTNGQSVNINDLKVGLLFYIL